MSSSPLRLKNSRNWFAAGLEVQQAMNILTDGAFKLFMFLCLNARRDSGILRTTQTDLARNLKMAQGTIRKYLRELENTGICIQNHFTNSPARQGIIQIDPRYWPYEVETEEASSDTAADVFVSEVRQALAARACVRSSFSTADEVVARKWFGQGVPLERIKQAILLGCSRKLSSWHNNQAHAPISTLHYFEPILDEIEKQKIDPAYWGYLEFRMQRHEKLWRQSHQGDLEPQTDSGDAIAKGLDAELTESRSA
jgi:hypothetical protein